MMVIVVTIVVVLCFKYDGRNKIHGGNGRVGTDINAHSDFNNGTMEKMIE